MSRKYYDFGDIFDLFDSVFNNSISRSFEMQQPARYNRLISTGDFPPANVVVNKETKELIIEVALAGCSEDNVKLSFDSDYLKLEVEIPQEDVNTDQFIVLQRGIKKYKYIKASWVVDPRFYNRDEVDVTLKDGLLTIRISPKDDVKPRKINVFGKLTTPEEREKLENKTE